jgi:mRNA-degrading endonuclease RelE of RelBE toxin-antitoxin system
MYHIYTFPWHFYGYPHDQRSHLPRKHASFAKGRSEKKRALRDHAARDSHSPGITVKSRSRLRRAGKAGGKREEGHALGEDSHLRPSSEISRLVRLHYTLDAHTELLLLPRVIAQRIARKMDWFIEQKDPLTFAKTLHDAKVGSHRFRVGDYRILVERHTHLSGVLTVVAVRHRSKAYE